MNLDVPTAPYRDSVLCKACETRVVITATKRNAKLLGTVKTFSVACPICESGLSVETRWDIDTSTVVLLGFEPRGSQVRIFPSLR